MIAISGSRLGYRDRCLSRKIAQLPSAGRKVGESPPDPLLQMQVEGVPRKFVDYHHHYPTALRCLKSPCRLVHPEQQVVQRCIDRNSGYADCLVLPTLRRDCCLAFAHSRRS